MQGKECTVGRCHYLLPPRYQDTALCHSGPSQTSQGGWRRRLLQSVAAWGAAWLRRASRLSFISSRLTPCAGPDRPDVPQVPAGAQQPGRLPAGLLRRPGGRLPGLGGAARRQLDSMAGGRARRCAAVVPGGGSGCLPARCGGHAGTQPPAPAPCSSGRPVAQPRFMLHHARPVGWRGQLGALGKHAVPASEAKLSSTPG